MATYTLVYIKTRKPVAIGDIVTTPIGGAGEVVGFSRAEDLDPQRTGNSLSLKVQGFIRPYFPSSVGMEWIRREGVRYKLEWLIGGEWADYHPGFAGFLTREEAERFIAYAVSLAGEGDTLADPARWRVTEVVG